ncbi:hypothetical protein ACROYT_G023610 [Oculina patagonica]
MAHERLGRDEILEKFIIEADYGTSGVFPYGAGATIVLSKVSCKNNDDDSWSMVGVHRNQERGIHAETKVFELIKRTSGNAGTINIELIQNFSPCNDIANDEFCAEKILNYKKRMESQGKQIDISITFANFYRAVVYKEHSKYGNNKNRAEQNRNGLRLLRDNGVQLRLLCGEEEWKKFLNDDQLVSLSDSDREECWNLAVSEGREKREANDMKHYVEIMDVNKPSDIPDAYRRLISCFSQLQVCDPHVRHNSKEHERLAEKALEKALEKKEIKFTFIRKRDTLGSNSVVDEVGEQVVLSKVSIYYPNDSLSMVTIHRRNTNPHAETKLLQLLRGISENAREIDIELIQNFSPCCDEANGQLCAREIVDYKNWIKCQPTKIDISITFANFYRTVKCDGNDEKRAEENRRGLRLLYDNEVQLRLLCGKEEWKKFLYDDQLVSLSEDDRKECFNLAVSAERHELEKNMRTHFWEVLKLS